VNDKTEETISGRGKTRIRSAEFENVFLRDFWGDSF